MRFLPLRRAPNCYSGGRIGVGDIVLSRIDAKAASDALAVGGPLDARRTDALGGLARRSLLALRRKLANKPELHQPSWASPPIDRLCPGTVARWQVDRK